MGRKYSELPSGPSITRSACLLARQGQRVRGLPQPQRGWTRPRAGSRPVEERLLGAYDPKGFQVGISLEALLQGRRLLAVLFWFVVPMHVVIVKCDC